MRIKDVNTTDIYAALDGAPARIAQIGPRGDGRLWIDRSRQRGVAEEFPIRPTDEKEQTASYSTGAVRIGHLVVMGSRSDYVQAMDQVINLGVVALPEWTGDNDTDAELAVKFSDTLAADNKGLRLTVANTKVLRRWEDYVAMMAALRDEAAEQAQRRENGRRTFNRAFQLITPALKEMGLSDGYFAGIDRMSEYIKSDGLETELNVPISVLLNLVGELIKARGQ